MGGGRVSGEHGREKVGAEWAEETTVVGLGGVAGAGGEGEGLERTRVGGGDAVEDEEEELVGERVQRGRGGGGGAGRGGGACCGSGLRRRPWAIDLCGLNQVRNGGGE